MTKKQRNGCVDTGVKMVIAKTSVEYAQLWKNEVSGVLYGPIADIYESEHTELNSRMRASVSKLCSEIDEVAQILDKQGVFEE